MVAVVALLLTVAAVRRARTGGVLDDPHRPVNAPLAGGVPGTPAPGGSAAATADADEAERLADHLVAQLRSERGVDLGRDALARQRLVEAAALAIGQLREHPKTATVQVNLPFLWADASGPGHLNATLQRAELEALFGRRES